MSTETMSNGSTTIVEEGIVKDDRGRVHENAVSEIVGMIRSKYEDEGTRNFAIGKRAFEHAQWQKGNFPGYSGSDFDTLMRRIRDDVRLYVPIKADSIRVDDWAKAYVLQQLVAEQIGVERATLISFFEYRTLLGKALSFDKKNVEGSLVTGWIDLINGIAVERESEGRVTSEDFLGRVSDNEKRIKAAAVVADPVQAAAVKAAGEITKKADDSRKANRAVTSAVSDALAKGNLSTDGILGIVEHVAKELKLPVPAAFGFDPTTCTVQDCELLAKAMFAAGKFTEMKALASTLGKMVSAVEKAREASVQSASVEIEPTAAKVAREQKTAESREDSPSKVGAALGRSLGKSKQERQLAKAG